MPLVMAKPGEAFTVSSLDGPHELQMRLVNLGIFPGAIIRILHRTSSTVLLKVQDTRLMIQQRLACQVNVK